MNATFLTRPPSVSLMRKLGLEPDPWQVDVLEGDHARLLLNCCRQAGKSTAVAMLGLAEALYTPGARVLLVSRSHRQSREVFRIATGFYRRLGSPLEVRLNADELELDNHSRIMSVPCKEETIRGYSGITTLIIDEASRVPDDVYRAVRPMLAASNGRLICLSTPNGKRGFFYDSWAKGGDDWSRIEIPARHIPRIKQSFLAEELRAMGESCFNQEYCCAFEAMEGLVFPNFDACVVTTVPSHIFVDPRQPSVFRGVGAAPARPTLTTDPSLRRVGGIDFGFRDPFVALWGTLDRDGVLWLTGEHYARQKPLSHHVQFLPRDVNWYADPSGASERAELLRAGFTVRKSINARRPGIAAVSARLQNGTLRVIEGACPNLLREADLYRYAAHSDEQNSESPADQNDHTLDALRYLIARIDEGLLSRIHRRLFNPDDPATESATPGPQASPQRRPTGYPVGMSREDWQRWNDSDMWTTFS